MNPLKALWTILLVVGLAGVNLWAALAYRQTLRPPPPPSPGPAIASVSPDGKAAGPGAGDGGVKDTHPTPTPPEPQTPKDKPPVVIENPPPDPNKEAFDRHMREGREQLNAKHLREAVDGFKAAKGLRPDDPDAAKALAEAEGRLREFTEAYDKGRKALGAGQFDDAVASLGQAHTLAPDDRDAADALADATRKAAAASAPLTGSAVVLLLHTRASRFTDPDCLNQLKDLQKEQGDKVLLGGRIYCLTTAGCSPWDAAAPPPPEAVWDDHDFDKMFAAAFQAVDALGGRAADKSVRAVLVWQTDVDPASFPDRKVEPPAGRSLRLCYRFTDRNQDSERLAKVFGPRNAARMKDVADLKTFVAYYLTH